MIARCPGPRIVEASPAWRPPAGSIDCHMHIFGPYDRYPLSAGRSYTPPEATVAMYRRTRDAIGFDRTVVVQPSVYGTDNTVTLDAIDAFGQDRARAVVVVDSAVAGTELSSIAERGACAVRFNAVSGNGTPLDQLEDLASLIRPMGWHVEIYCRAEQLVEIEPLLPHLDLPVVIDHMGGVQAAGGGEASEAFAALIRMLERGAWAKLCGYRSSRGFPYDDVRAMAQAMIAAAPSRCIWGTDWPHPSLRTADEVPDDTYLVDLLGDWAPSAALRQAILVDNPARLYGF